MDTREATNLGARQRSALASVAAAAALVAAKLVAGLATGSLGLLAEAAHSATDLVAALLTVFAIRVAVRPADSSHHYGHGKAEHLAALAESVFLVAVSTFLGYQAFGRLVSSATARVDATWWSIGLLVVVIGIDISRAVGARRAATRFASPALRSNALHFAADLGGSVAVLAGLVAVRAGEPRADAAAALGVAVLVAVAASRLAAQSVDVLMDRASDEIGDAVSAALSPLVSEVTVRRVRIRHAAGRHFIDVVVGVGADTALSQAHRSADAVEQRIMQAVAGADVMVHVEPATVEGSLRECATAAALSVGAVREVHNVRVMSTADGVELSLHVKLPGAFTLGEAHDAVEQVEAAIRRDVPQVRFIHTHIEPLALTGEAVALTGGEVAQARRVIDEVVRDKTGQTAGVIEFRDADAGRVALVEVRLPADASLSAAHERAGEIEHAVRQRCPELADVIVHTAPVATSGE